jgi:hypothetical protein
LDPEVRPGRRLIWTLFLIDEQPKLVDDRRAATVTESATQRKVASRVQGKILGRGAVAVNVPATSSIAL